jgi:putative Holliday junction resolvase
MTYHNYILGLDFGYKKIGVAIGQTVTKTASPLLTIPAIKGIPDKFIFNRLISTWEPSSLIVGFPLTLNGEVQKVTEQVNKFVKYLKKIYLIPIYLIDERLSSYEARIYMKTKLIDKKNKIKTDSIAACIILEDWFNLN